MVDSRAKGARGEYLVRDMLRTATNVSGDAMISFIIDKSEK